MTPLSSRTIGTSPTSSGPSPAIDCPWLSPGRISESVTYSSISPHGATNAMRYPREAIGQGPDDRPGRAARSAPLRKPARSPAARRKRPTASGRRRAAGSAVAVAGRRLPRTATHRSAGERLGLLEESRLEWPIAPHGSQVGEPLPVGLPLPADLELLP